METEQTLNVERLQQSVSNRKRCVACTRENPPN